MLMFLARESVAAVAWAVAAGEVAGCGDVRGLCSECEPDPLEVVEPEADAIDATAINRKGLGLVVERESNLAEVTHHGLKVQGERQAAVCLWWGQSRGQASLRHRHQMGH